MEKQNYNGRPLNEFTENDTLYVSKMGGSYRFDFLIRFISIDKGKVTGTILEIQPNNPTSVWIGTNFYQVGDSITAMATKCYTRDNKNSCRWFSKVNGVYI